MDTRERRTEAMADEGTNAVRLEKGWDAETPQDPELGFFSLSEAVGEAAEARSDEKGRAALTTLAQVLGMTFMESRKEPEGAAEGEDRDVYRPWMNLGGRRTMEEADLDMGGLAGVMVEGALTADNPWIVSRLGDLAHRMLGRGGVPEELKSRADAAGAAAVKAAMRIDPRQAQVEARYTLVRAGSIARDKAESDPGLRDRLIAHCERILDETADRDKPRARPWMVEAAQRALGRMGAAKNDPERVARTLIGIGERYTDEEGPNAWTEAAWESAYAWAAKAGKRSPLAKHCMWRWGQENVRFALAEDQDSGPLRRLIVYDQAIPRLAQGAKVGGEEGARRAAELEEAKRERTRYARRVADGEEMTRLEVPLPEGIEKHARKLREHLKGKSLAKVMTILTFAIGRLEAESYFKKAAKPMTEGLAGTVSRTHLDRGGQPTRLSKQEADRADQMTVFDGWARAMTLTGIGPCLDAIREEHSDGDALEKWAAWTCANSEWTPSHAAGSWEAGLVAGLRQEWKQSMDLLLPRMEGCLRALNSRLGREEADLTLGQLLTAPGYRDLICDEWRYALEAVLRERRGWNLRNDHCHGRMSDEEYASGPCVFFWWLALHFTASAVFVKAPPFGTPDLDQFQRKEEGGGTAET